MKTIRWEDYMRLQAEEMRRHKWIESEKAGRDLGQAVILDWIERHAPAFRTHYLRTLDLTIQHPPYDTSR